MNAKQTLVFAIFATVFTVSTFVEPYPLSWAVKLIPMAILILICFSQESSRTQKLFLMGLIFSAMGDFLLAYDPGSWFIFGLGSFLIAHLFYLMCFWPVEKKHLGVAAAYLIYGIAMFSIISPSLGKLFMPVLAYMSVLLLMGLFTLFSVKSNRWLIIGGLSFIASDSLLGVNKFHVTIPYAHLLIMSTYYFAQFALVKGIFNIKSED